MVHFRQKPQLLNFVSKMEGSLLLAAESSPSLGIYPWVEGKLPFAHNWSGRQRRESSAQGPQVLAWCGESHPLSSFLSNCVKNPTRHSVLRSSTKSQGFRLPRRQGASWGFHSNSCAFLLIRNNICPLFSQRSGLAPWELTDLV